MNNLPNHIMRQSAKVRAIRFELSRYQPTYKERKDLRILLQTMQAGLTSGGYRSAGCYPLNHSRWFNGESPVTPWDFGTDFVWLI